VPSYTIDTLRVLRERHPAASFRWVMGVDLLPQVDRWKEWPAIAGEFSPIVVGRGGHGQAAGSPTFPQIASTDIRRALARGEPETRMPQAVTDAVGRWFAPVPLARTTAFDGLLDVCHGFSGADDGLGERLDLGWSEKSAHDRYHQDWVRTLATLAERARLSQVVMAEQVHGGAVIVNPSPNGVHRFVGAGDGLVTTVEDVILTIRTADCVPVLFASPKGLAAAHAGWRGVAANVCRQTVEALCMATGETASDVRAVIGPHISSQAYEVGEEVVQGIAATGVPEDLFTTREGGTIRVDLLAAVRGQLQMAGLHEVEVVEGCTYSDTGLHSYRRDGEAAGRQVAMIARLSS